MMVVVVMVMVMVVVVMVVVVMVVMVVVLVVMVVVVMLVVMVVVDLRHQIGASQEGVVSPPSDCHMLPGLGAAPSLFPSLFHLPFLLFLSPILL